MISCKNARGRVLSYHPGAQSKILLNGVDYHTILSRRRMFDHHQAVRLLLDRMPGLYHLQILGGGMVSRIDMVPHLIYCLHKDKLNMLQSDDIERISKSRKDVRYPKKYGGRKSRARFQKSYR